jgi:hypothetical protein
MEKDLLVKKNTTLPVAATMLVVALTLFGGIGIAQGAAGLADVKRDFNEICSNSTNGDLLGKEELQNLIARCDKLKPHIEGLDDADRRFYLRRLKSCRDLYQFMLDTSEPAKPATSPAATVK